MNNEICANCGREKREHEGPKYSCLGLLSGKFKPSGRIAVPVAFIETLRETVENALGEWVAVETMFVPLPFYGWKRVQDMLDQIEKE